ncbi:KilA-N domain-containing protein [Acetobacter pasteurianus]|uniref:KilA-N domain-containing protein n=1 Tax=Acetobacter pasteurianus TaxID=438 RepID=UPI00350E39D0
MCRPASSGLQAGEHVSILSTSIRQDAEGRYSLSDCWKASGKDKKNQPSKWFEAEKTQEFLRVLGGDPENRATPVSLVTTGPNEGRGYWADRKAVIHYATWISADFYLTMNVSSRYKPTTTYHSGPHIPGLMCLAYP